MKPRMKPSRAVAICGRGPKTEAQRTQALAALRRMQLGLEADYPNHCADTCTAINVAMAELRTAPLRGQE